MPADDEMTIDERRKYLKRMEPRYRMGTKEQRGELLGEMEQVTGLHRKSLIRLLNGASLERTSRQRQRGIVYGAAVDDVIRVVWESLDYICAERLTPALLPTAEHLVQFDELHLSPEAAAHLGRISCSTVQRILTRLRQDTPRLPRRGPEQANKLRAAVPMERIPWNTAEPGYFEVDLVHHGGASSGGTYLHTLQMIDVATGWSERVAVLGRSQEAMEGGFRRIQARVPFAIKHLHPDNGSEFFNDHLVRYWGETITGLTLSRSRPYHKNDNRFVEQKNDTLVRAYLGHERLDTPAQCDAVNALYDQLWVYYNLFQPVLHLASKDIIAGKVQRRWDQAQTPYQRLQAAAILEETVAERLADQHATTNPRQLRRMIYDTIPRLWDAPHQAASTRHVA
jgi:hypothetical protein